MTKEDLVKEFNRLIESHYSEEIDSRDEWLREIIDLKDNVVKNLNIPDVVGKSELLKAFVEFYNNRQNSDKRICYDEIDIYLESP